jgi:hypothetical protein
MAPCAALLLIGAGCVRTDQKLYAAAAPGIASFGHWASETLYLGGCAPFVVERRIDGAWVDVGPPFHCVWDGIAVAVEPDERIETPFDAPSDSGSYRLRYEYGARCQPGRPLHDAKCEFRSSAFSNTFEVEREICDANEPECRFVPAAPNYLCDDGEHFGGPSGQCTRDPSSGRCGYEFLRCP